MEIQARVIGVRPKGTWRRITTAVVLVVGMTPGVFRAGDHFVVNGRDTKGPANIGFVSPDFRTCLLEGKNEKVEMVFGPLAVSCVDIETDMSDSEIVANHGGKSAVAIPVETVEALILGQINGEEGPLSLTEGNIIYVEDNDGVVHVVQLDWWDEDRGWYINLFEFDSGDHADGSRIFVRAADQALCLVGAENSLQAAA